MELPIFVEIVQLTDPLSQVLALLELRKVETVRFEAGGAWRLPVPPKSYLKLHAILRGSCWIRFADGEPLHLAQGDVFLLARSPALTLSREPTGDGPASPNAVEHRQPNVQHLGGDETTMLGASFVFEPQDEDLIADSLPPLIHVPAPSRGASVVRTVLEMLDRELTEEAIGATLVRSRLVDIVLVEALRAYATERPAAEVGWLAALGDRRIGAAIAAMHAGVDRRWTVAELASAVGMSRSSFAAAFRARLGVTPLAYLNRWRMHLARADLHRGDMSVARLAARYGYASESAFGNAFKRVNGVSPRHCKLERVAAP